MEKIKVNYIKSKNNITSFSIGFEAGAINEEGYPLGTAHLLEHMLFKRTKNRDEDKISRDIDKYFGFSNAMTNYPYSIYYGSLISDNLENCLDVYSDIIKNPVFEEEELKDEMKIVKEELHEWKDDVHKYLEDEAFFNGFSKRRIKYPIIGKETSLDDINTTILESFYKKFYTPSNCVITISTNLEKTKVLEVIEKHFSDFTGEDKTKIIPNYEKNNAGIFVKDNMNLQGAKIKYLFSISDLEEKGIYDLKVFDYIFGRVGYGILYSTLRTEKSLCYDVYTEIKNEKGIKLYAVNINVSRKNIYNAINIINDLIENIKTRNYSLDEISQAMDKIKLFKTLRHEKSLILCNDITTEELMDTADNAHETDSDKITYAVRKVLNNPTIQILY